MARLVVDTKVMAEVSAEMSLGARAAEDLGRQLRHSARQLSSDRVLQGALEQFATAWGRVIGDVSDDMDRMADLVALLAALSADVESAVADQMCGAG